MNILLVVTGATGLQYHRQISPHSVLHKVFGDAVNITATNNFDQYPDEKLKQQQIVHFMRVISNTGQSEAVVNRCHKHGARVVFDIDDHWDLPSDHGHYKINKLKNVGLCVKDALRHCDLITTTTWHFKSILHEMYGNTKVLPNCIDITEQQWQNEKVKSDKLRFGWVGGIWHKEDLRLIEKSVTRIYSDTNVKDISLVLGGYTPNDEYNEIARIMSYNGKGITSGMFRTVAGTTYDKYGAIYNYIDVLLVPLRNNKFNACKSPLKLIEAAAMGCAAIASDVSPYDIFPNDVVYKIDKYDNDKGWYKAVKKFSESPDMVKDYAGKLAEYCDKNYNAFRWAETRYQIYKELIK